MQVACWGRIYCTALFVLTITFSLVHIVLHMEVHVGSSQMCPCGQELEHIFLLHLKDIQTSGHRGRFPCVTRLTGKLQGKTTNHEIRINSDCEIPRHFLVKAMTLTIDFELRLRAFATHSNTITNCKVHLATWLVQTVDRKAAWARPRVCACVPISEWLAAFRQIPQPMENMWNWTQTQTL